MYTFGFSQAILIKNVIKYHKNEGKMEIFAKRLKKLRLENNLTLRDLANEINVSHGAIDKWEKGKSEPNIINLIALAKFFDVSVSYLCGTVGKDGRIQ